MVSFLVPAVLSLLARAPLATAAPTDASMPMLIEESIDMAQASEELLSLHKQLKQEEDGISFRMPSPIDVDLYTHVVTSTKETQNNASDENIQWMMNALNAAYKPAKVTFHHRHTSRTINPTWAINQDNENMRSSLRKGDKSTLNVYLLEAVDSGVKNFRAAGKATFPDWLQRDNGLSQDGALISLTTFPGGVSSQRRSKTCIHEVGHWFGLMHTFQGGCDGGDGIDDTPAEAGPSRDCNPRDTCPNKPGMDPIRNFMDYSPDECMTEFTPGQIDRIHGLWEKLRATEAPPTTSAADNSQDEARRTIQQTFARLLDNRALEYAMEQDATLDFQLRTKFEAAEKDLLQSIGKPDFKQRVQDHFADFLRIPNLQFAMDKMPTLQWMVPRYFDQAEEDLKKLA